MICHRFFPKPRSLRASMSRNSKPRFASAGIAKRNQLNVDKTHFQSKISSFGFKNAPNRAHLVDDFRPHRSDLNSFPFYPLHASQAGPQNISQVCVLLVQVACLGDFRATCADIMARFSHVRCHFEHSLAYHVPLWTDSHGLEASRMRSPEAPLRESRSEYNLRSNFNRSSMQSR